MAQKQVKFSVDSGNKQVDKLSRQPDGHHSAYYFFKAGTRAGKDITLTSMSTSLCPKLVSKRNLCMSTDGFSQLLVVLQKVHLKVPCGIWNAHLLVRSWKSKNGFQCIVMLCLDWFSFLENKSRVSVLGCLGPQNGVCNFDFFYIFRLRTQLQSLQKEDSEQKEFMQNFLMNRWSVWKWTLP